MRDQPLRLMATLALAVQLGACQDATAPDTALVLSRAPDLTAVVFQSTHESGFTPGGYVSQYDVWIGDPGAAPEAGVVVGEPTPVFIRSDGKLIRTSGAAIMAGDTIQVWRATSVAYGAVEAPPGKPCYEGTQIVIQR